MAKANSRKNQGEKEHLPTFSKAWADCKVAQIRSLRHFTSQTNHNLTERNHLPAHLQNQRIVQRQSMWYILDICPSLLKSPHNELPLVTALHTIKKFPNNHMITFFGVSGCGQTRAVVEMLDQNWRFYLNGSQANRGLTDVTTLFELVKKMPTRYFSSDKVQNGLNIQAITGCLLISRLMVLQHCLSLGRRDTFTCAEYAWEPLTPQYRMSLTPFLRLH